MRIRAVLFDLVGTLVTVRGSVGSQYARVASRHGVEADPAALDLAFKSATRSAEAIEYTGVSPSEAASIEKEWWRRLVREVFRRAGAEWPAGDEFDVFFDRLFVQFTTAEAWEVYADVRGALDALSEGGIRCGLVTNFDSRVRALLRGTGLERYFPVVAIPALTGYSKPQAGVFRAALLELGVSHDEAVHVGDSLEHDVSGALAAGVKPVWLDRRGRKAPGNLVRITSLDELRTADWLERLLETP